MSTYPVNDQAGLEDALSSGDADVSILITGNFSMSESVTVPASGTVSIASQGGPFTVTRGAGAGGFLITVPQGGSLEITDLTFDGGGTASPQSALVRNDGLVSLGGGARLTNNTSDSVAGGVHDTGTLIMSGNSEISNNTAAGVGAAGEGGGVHNTGTVRMSGTSAVSGNTATSRAYPCAGGGIYNAAGGVLLIGPDASVTGNSAASAGARTGDGGGVCSLGEFTMSGGSVSFNEASSAGGGIYSTGRLTVNGGAVVSNSSHESGGGVYSDGSFQLGGLAYLTGNRSNSGGGVFNHKMFILSDFAQITANSADLGGGILNSGSFAMTGGPFQTMRPQQEAGFTTTRPPCR